jgi:iron complex outermembrane receptor protein
VNVVTKKQSDGFLLAPSFSTGSFGFVNPSLVSSLSAGRFRVLGGYSYRHSDSFVDGSGRNVTSYGNYMQAGRDNPAFDINTGWGSLGFDIARNQSIDVSYTHQAGGLTLYPPLSMDAPYDKADRLTANWNLRELKGVLKQVRVQSYFSRVKHWMTDELRTSAAGAPLGFSMGTFASTKNFGGRVEAELAHTIVGAESYDRGWDAVGSVRMGMMYTASHSLPDARTVVAGLYAQHRQNFGRLTLTLGGRLDAASSAALARDVNTDLYWAYHNTRSTSASDLSPSGTISAAYLLPRGIELFAGVGSIVRLPDPEERYYAVKKMGSDWVGNPLLQSARNNEKDIGINFRGRHFTLRPTLFYSSLDNFIAIDLQRKINPLMSVMNPSARSYENVDAHMYGGEVAYSVGLTRSLLLSGGLSCTRGVQYAKPAAGLSRTDMAEMPPFRSHASLRYGRSVFFAEVNAIAVARQDRIDSALQEQPTAGYALLGIKAGIHYKLWNIAAGIDNLTDRFYYEHLSYQRDPYRSGVRMPEPGRAIFLNISRIFQFGSR